MHEPSLGGDAVADTSESLPPEARLAAQVAKTDARLKSWRAQSVNRRLEWEAAQDLALAAHHARRRRVLRTTALALVSAAAVGLLVGAVLVRYWPQNAPAVDNDVRRAQALAMQETAGLRADPPADPPVGVAEIAEVAETSVVAAVPQIASTLPLIEGSARVWTEEAHIWATFRSIDQGGVVLRYFDGAGNPALEQMNCQAAGPDGVRTCLAGRSEYRLQLALENEGAVPGTWTVRGCDGDRCTDIGTFKVK